VIGPVIGFPAVIAAQNGPAPGSPGATTPTPVITALRPVMSATHARIQVGPDRLLHVHMAELGIRRER
jgi:hypothetical protein